MSVWRSRWAAVGAAVAVSVGTGGFGLAGAAIDSGDKPVTVTIAPQRILDTRSDLGLPGRFVNETPRDLQVTGSVPVASGGTETVVPSDAVAVVVNVTVVNPDSNGYLSVRPAGAAGIPTTSTVNFLPGTIEPNAATVDLGSGGRIQVFLKTALPTGSADVLVDVVGYTVDHTHDDIYLTKAEVAALIAELEKAQPFVLSDSTDGDVELTDVSETIVSVQVTAPVAGQVSIVAAANVDQIGALAADVDCDINTATSGKGMELWFERDEYSDSGNVAGTRVFDLAADATETYRLQCRESADGGFLDQATLTAFFTPAP